VFCVLVRIGLDWIGCVWWMGGKLHYRDRNLCEFLGDVREMRGGVGLRGGCG
jgi:hypothetical protein